MALEMTNLVGRVLAVGTSLYPCHGVGTAECGPSPSPQPCSPPGVMKGSAREEVGWAGGRRAGFESSLKALGLFSLGK